MRGVRGAGLAFVCLVGVAGCSSTTGSTTFTTSSASPGSSLTEPSDDASDALPGDASCSELTAWAERTSSAVAAIVTPPTLATRHGDAEAQVLASSSRDRRTLATSPATKQPRSASG